jgi:hypothetical protein
MTSAERRVAREAKAMTRKEVVLKAMGGRITWLQAADILGMTPRHLRRVREAYERYGFTALQDGRARNQRCHVSAETVAEVCRLKREVYEDFSVKHFHEFVTERHKLKISYTWTKLALQAAGLAEKAPARGKYRRKRERRPMRGMMLHLDASKHEWLPGLPMWDLNVVLDDADGKMLFAEFVQEEGTLSTFQALKHVLGEHGRFCELYTDRGSHFCRTRTAGAGPDEVQKGQVARALRALGIRHILARSPEARGRSERAFGTIQGRLPQELRLAGITTYAEANAYLKKTFLLDFNKKFTVEPAQPESAFLPLVGVDLELLLSIHQERIVGKDSTVSLDGLTLQLPPTSDRMHYVRCPVVVNELIDGTLGVSYQGKLLAKYDRSGRLLDQAYACRRRAP